MAQAGKDVKVVELFTMNKQCSTCKEVKEIDSFGKKGLTKDGTQRYIACCKSCTNTQRNERYARKDSKIRANQKLRVIARVNEISSLIQDMKRNPCTDCGRSFDPVAMDFDHLDGSTKLMAVSYMVYKGHSLESILKEIEKCELVCAVCHRLRGKHRIKLQQDLP